MFEPIVPPPSEHHPLNTGHSTEFGDSAKTMVEKINAGFKHVYESLKAAGVSVVAEVPKYFGEFEQYFRAAFHTIDTDVTALKSRVTELEAELNNVKMIVQGLGFRGVADLGTSIDPKASPVAITDPSHSSAPVVTVTETKPDESYGTVTDPVVTVIGSV